MRVCFAGRSAFPLVEDGSACCYAVPPPFSPSLLLCRRCALLYACRTTLSSAALPWDVQFAFVRFSGWRMHSLPRHPSATYRGTKLKAGIPSLLPPYKLYLLYLIRTWRDKRPRVAFCADIAALPSDVCRDGCVYWWRQQARADAVLVRGFGVGYFSRRRCGWDGRLWTAAWNLRTCPFLPCISDTATSTCCTAATPTISSTVPAYR